MQTKNNSFNNFANNNVYTIELQLVWYEYDTVWKLPIMQFVPQI